MNKNRFLINLIPESLALFLLFIPPSLEGQGTHYPKINEKDSLALVELYNATGGANWTYKFNWLTGRVHTWSGITVNPGESRVKKINLYLNNLTGILPEALSLVNMTELEELILYGNKLSGAIPDWLDKLPALKKLDLHDNQFSSIPASLGNCKNLTGLDLSGNNFTGEIPGFLGNIASLVSLKLNKTGFTGSIPLSFRNLANLTALEICNTNLDGSGHIGSLAGLSKLSYLLLFSNKFTGPIPESIRTLTGLTTFSMLNNKLTDTIPGTIGNLTLLEYMELGMNKLTGLLPNSINNLSKLTDLRISNNYLSGLPNINLPKLKIIQLFGNRFTFRDLIPNVNAATTVEYAPQDSVGEKETYFVEYGKSLTIVADDVGGINNIYNWFRNGMEVPGQNTGKFTIKDASRADSGVVYLVKIKNSALPLLTLDTRPKKILTAESLYPEMPDFRDPNLKVVVVGISNDVLVSLQGREWKEAKEGQMLTWGDEVMLGIDSEVIIQLPDRSTVKLKEMSAMKIGSLFLERDTRKTRLMLIIGELEAQVPSKKTVHSDFSVESPVATASVRGTCFGIKHDSVTRVTTVSVAEGNVVVKPEGYDDYKSGKLRNALLDSVILTNWQQITVNESGLGNIENIVLDRIQLSPDTTWLDADRRAKIFVTGIDKKGLRMAVRVNWETKGGTIDSTGVITAGKYTGFYTVTATEPVHNLKATTVVHINGWTVGTNEFQSRKDFQLEQNHPNPFQESTTIIYRVEKPGKVRLNVYNISGRLMRKIVDEFKQPGIYEEVFKTGTLNKGIYFYTLRSGNRSETKKMVVQ